MKASRSPRKTSIGLEMRKSQRNTRINSPRSIWSRSTACSEAGRKSARHTSMTAAFLTRSINPPRLLAKNQELKLCHGLLRKRGFLGWEHSADKAQSRYGRIAGDHRS